MAENEGFADNETGKRAKGHSIEDEKEIRAVTEAWYHTHFRSTTAMKESG